MKVKRFDIFGKDSLLMHSFQYYFLPAFIYFGFLWPQNIHPFALIFFVYGLLPLLDEWFAFDWRNPTEEERQELERKNPWFQASLFLSLLLDWLALFKMLRIFSEMTIGWDNIIHVIATTYILTHIGAVSFLVAHEIFHKNGAMNKAIGTLHMLKVFYMHFTVQHLYGHHKNVATPEDPASAEKGLTLYQFLPRTLVGSLKSAYSIQQSKGKPILLNSVVLNIVSSLLFTAIVLKYYGLQATLIYLVYAFGSIFYLESINYLEHYGLRRNKLPSGQYEKVTIRHSWNAPHRFTNYLLFKLQRHSDHHENSLKPYQTLLSLEDSPNLPHGYSVMILMTLFPSTWFRIMDPLVDEYERKKKGQICGEATEMSEKLTRQFIYKSVLITGLLTLVFH